MDPGESRTIDSREVPAPPGYRVDRELGRGGMGVVYLARQEGLNRTVALKMILGGGQADQKQLIRFLAEAEAVAAVKHANVVGVYQYGEHNGSPYMALEYCPGGSLHARLQVERLTYQKAAEWIADISSGVAAAHGLGIVHRDLKPHNVLLAEDGRLKVTDFGLAKRNDSGDLTRTDAIMGTPAYMSPEQAQGGTKFVGPTADVWSLGVMLYEMLTGERPFVGRDAWEVLAAVIKEEFTPPRKKVITLPRDLELICLKCLQSAPHARYPSAAELEADLRRFLAGQPVSVRAAGLLERSWKWVRRNSRLAAALAGIAASLLIGTVVAVYLAILASDRAQTAERNSIAARHAEHEARQKENEANASKLQTREALDEAEITLAESLLRPIGYDPTQMTKLEHSALQELANLKNDEVRWRFLRAGLADAAAAKRLGIRSEAVARALVGLDQQRRRIVEHILQERLSDPTLPRDAVLTCVCLAEHIECNDPQLAKLGMEKLIEQARQRPYVVHEMKTALGTVQATISFIDLPGLQIALANAPGLVGALRAEDADRLTMLLFEALRAYQKPTIDAFNQAYLNLRYLSQCLRAILPKLNPADAPARINQAIDLLFLANIQNGSTTTTYNATGQAVLSTDFQLIHELLTDVGATLDAIQADTQARTILAYMYGIANHGNPPTAEMVGLEKLPEIKWSLLNLQSPTHGISDLAASLTTILRRLPLAQAEGYAQRAADLLADSWKPKDPRTSPIHASPCIMALAPLLSSHRAHRLAELLVPYIGTSSVSECLEQLFGRMAPDEVQPLATQAGEVIVQSINNQPAKPSAVYESLAKVLPGVMKRMPPAQASDLANRLLALVMPKIQGAFRPDETTGRFALVEAVIPFVSAEHAEQQIAPTIAEPSGRVSLPAITKEWLIIRIYGDRLAFDAVLRFLKLRPIGRSREVLSDRLRILLETLPPAELLGVLDQMLGAGLTDPEAYQVFAMRLPEGQHIEAARRIVERMHASSTRSLFVVLANFLPRIAKAEAAKMADEVCGFVLAQFARGQEEVTSNLMRALRTSAPYLTAEMASGHFEKVIKSIAEARFSSSLARHVQAMAALAPHVSFEIAKAGHTKASELLVAALAKAEFDPSAYTAMMKYQELIDALDALSGIQPVALTGEQTDALLQATKQSKQTTQLLSVAQMATKLLPRLPESDRTRAADALAYRALEFAGGTESPMVLSEIAITIRAIAPWLSAEQKAMTGASLAKAMTRAWERSPKNSLTGQLAYAFSIALPHFTNSARIELAARLHTAMRQYDTAPNDPSPSPRNKRPTRSPVDSSEPWAWNSEDDVLALVTLVQALLPHLEADDAGRLRVGIAVQCLALESLRTKHDRKRMPNYLTGLVSTCSQIELRDILRSPVSTGEIQNWILNELSRRAGRSYRTVWELAD